MMQTEEKVKTTITGGRKRAHLVKFFLNDEEYEKLCKDAASVNKDLSKYLRLVIHWIAPIEPPSVEVKELMRELRRVGVNMNQIAAKAHSLGFVDELEYRRNADAVMRVLGAIQQEYAKKGVKLFGNN
ncbi:MAG: hypothetical protein J6A83_09175 [Clostridia bacterium]|nr:hypothetical protein [Clostridia bacterium]